MKECKYCGTQYADHLQSCPSCGANVVVSEKDRIIEDAHKEQEITSVKKQIEEQRKTEKPKMAPGKKILIVMCSIVAVLAVVIIVTTFLNNRSVTTDGKTNNDLAKEYEAAMESIEVGNYEAAIAELDSIPAEYKDYDKVTEQKEKAIEAYREQVLAQVDSYVAVGKHNDALSALTVAMDKYGENKELAQKKDEILYGYKQGIFAEAENYATTGDYSTAIKRLQMLLEVVGTDTDTEMKIQYYEKAQVLKQVQMYENENNYTAAMEYLAKKLETMGQDADLATKLIGLQSTYKTFCMNEVKAYIAENNYEKAITILEDLSKAIGTDDEVTMLIHDYKKSLVLEKSQSYIDNDDYIEGIRYLKLQIQLLGEDTALTSKMNEVTSLYKSDMVQVAEKDAKNGQYANAVSTLRTVISTIGNDVDVEAKILEYRKKEINVKLAEFDKSKDYAGAITYLQGVSEAKTDAELKTKLENYISKYKKDLFSMAATAYEENGYSAAVQLLGNDKVLKNDIEVSQKIEYYKNKRPIALSGIDYYSKAGYFQIYTRDIKDILGNIYNGGFGVYVCNSWKDIIYYTNMQYETLSAKLVIVDVNKVIKWKSEVKIIDADTDEVLYTTRLTDKDAEGIEFKVDISQVKFLKIELKGYSDDIAVMVNAQLIKK